MGSPRESPGPANSDRINYLNIGLMVASCAVALFIPFELFLFAYAILGPAHYLTEISWLQKRQFFTRGKYDFWLLGALAAVGTFTLTSSPRNATYTFLALGIALVFMLTGKVAPRILGLVPVIALAFLLLNTTSFITVALALFVPTLVHVYLFTGFFIVYGALKERSRSGYIAFGVFLLCPVACWFVDPGFHLPTRDALIPYWNNFSTLNLTILGIPSPHSTTEAREALSQMLTSHSGLIVMRFIAFAYTYHYLNWFSKTSIIRWHEVGRTRIAVIAVLWLGSIGTYFYDFSLGFKLLFYLSITHVYLEFPLNHLSIIGTFKELGSMVGFSRTPAVAAARTRKSSAYGTRSPV
ncbi:MAG: hypothetical protein ABSB67_08605 [Bryobacteraceae bacterium]|jgi:hypothetical protein